ncbi:MAG: rod shape-determining protein RodA [Acidobacteria bacterium]|nr:rod shape-determining protein RodA [Candidatus Sulfomarinibacter sp. MAG AM1]
MEHRVDPWLILAVIGILGASLTTLHTVSRVIGTNLLLRQLVWGVAGLITLWLLSRVRLDVFERLAPLLYGVGLIALVAVLLFGVARGGNRAWIAIGPLTIQPSEFVRLAVILMVAAWLADRRGDRLKTGEVFVAVLLVGIPVGLIILEPDLGVALTYLPILGGALWLGGLPRTAWIILIVLAVISSGAAWRYVLKPYQKDRVLTLLQPERDPFGAGYQVRQSKIAVGSGGISGQGLGRGSQSQLRFLPAQHTDFAFAVWAEATGFVGTTILLLAYALLFTRIAKVALTTDSRHGLILAALVGVWLVFQVVVSLGMVLGWLPTTGVTLPLFSYGGSSLISTCAALGIVQSVWRFRLVNQ